MKGLPFREIIVWPVSSAMLACLLSLPAALWAGPSFDCSKVEPGSTEEMICNDAALAALDRKLAEAYTAALSKTSGEHPPLLKAEQRGWIKGRNDCWKKSNDRRQCVEVAYRLRIAELQARYRLVASRGPFTYLCQEEPNKEITVTFFATAPPTLIARCDGGESLMYGQPSGSGSRYQGRNESFWEHHGDAIITWGYGSLEWHCTLSATDTSDGD